MSLQPSQLDPCRGSPAPVRQAHEAPQPASASRSDCQHARACPCQDSPAAASLSGCTRRACKSINHRSTHWHCAAAQDLILGSYSPRRSGNGGAGPLTLPSLTAAASGGSLTQQGAAGPQPALGTHPRSSPIAGAGGSPSGAAPGALVDLRNVSWGLRVARFSRLGALAGVRARSAGRGRGGCKGGLLPAPWRASGT